MYNKLYEECAEIYEKLHNKLMNNEELTDQEKMILYIVNQYEHLYSMLSDDDYDTNYDM